MAELFDINIYNCGPARGFGMKSNCCCSMPTYTNSCFGGGFSSYCNPFGFGSNIGCCMNSGFGFGAGIGLGFMGGAMLCNFMPTIFKGIGKLGSWSWNNVLKPTGKAIGNGLSKAWQCTKGLFTKDK